MNKIVVQYSRILINDYTLGDCEQLEKYLSIWDKATFRYIPMGYFYDEENKQLRIPKGVNVGYIEKLIGTTSVMDYEPDSYDRCSIKTKVYPRDDIQRKAIAFLVGENGFEYSKKYSQMLLSLGTGTGKTYVTCASSQFFETKIIVITPLDKIKKQWYDSFINMTDINDLQICDIDSSATIRRLLKQKKSQYKVYLVNHGTINAYAKANGWEAVHDLFKFLKVGIKVYDEAHLNFENTIRIDMNTNTKRTIYLTATFERSDKTENVLFNKCFKNVVRFGEEVKSEIRKHIMYLGVMYNSHPRVIDEARMKTMRGWNKIKYANYQENDNKFFEAIYYAINYFRKYEGKIMILSTTIKLVDKITEYIKENFPELSVSSYHSKMTNDAKEYALSCDVISTTPKSSGTGVDIRGLRTVIMTEAYSSTVAAEQISGRLREYSDTDKTFYVELVDKGFDYAYRMYRRRQSVFKKKCKKLLVVDLSDKGDD